MSLLNKLFRATILKSLIAALFICAPAAYTTMAQQETPPPPSAPRALSLPKPVERSLKNGLRVIVIERAGVPLTTAQLMIKNGSEVDPPQLAGLANMTAALLTEGTATRTAPQIAEAIEALGGTLDSAARWDYSVAQINVMSSNFDPAMAILADVIRRPAFKDEEIERQRQQLEDELRVALSQPGTLARAVAARVVFGDQPYGHTLQGTPESLARIKRDDIVGLHSAYYRPDNAILVIGGDLKPDAAFKIAEKFFGDWQKPSTPLPAASAAKRPESTLTKRPAVLVIDKPDAGQAAVLLVRTGLQRTDPDYFRGLVANSVLTGYSGRLNQEIRIKRGLSYGAGSILDVRREVGPFIAVTQTKNQSGAEVASLLLSEVKRLSSEPVADVELTPRKAVLIGNFGRNLETSAGLVTQIGALALYGLSLDEINRYIQNVQAIGAGDVQKFAGSRLSATDASIIIVGDAKQFMESLRKQFPDIEVIPASELDLNSAALRHAQTGGTKQ